MYDCSCNRWNQGNWVCFLHLSQILCFRVSFMFFLFIYLWSLWKFDTRILSLILGFRYAIVEELASFGARVHTCDIDQTSLDECLSEWQRKGFQVSGSICDVTSRPQRDQLMQTVSSLFGSKLNILVKSSPTFLMHFWSRLSLNFFFCLCLLLCWPFTITITCRLTMLASSC